MNTKRQRLAVADSLRFSDSVSRQRLASASLGLPSRILLQQLVEIDCPLRNRHQLVLVGDRRVVRLWELAAAAALEALHAFLDACFRPVPVALAVEVAVRSL